MVFTGTYEHAIDSKQRLAIPSRVRAQVQRELGLGEGDVIRWKVALGPSLLRLYTVAEFGRIGEELKHSGFDEAFERSFFSKAEEVETDTNGRIRLPELLLKRSGLAGDVVLLGNNDHLEIRDRAAWAAEEAELYEQRPELLMNPRQAMRAAMQGK
ncbi:MAG: hypothetical protein AAF586_00465 [Planctomycetota bacterium]